MKTLVLVILVAMFLIGCTTPTEPSQSVVHATTTYQRHVNISWTSITDWGTFEIYRNGKYLTTVRKTKSFEDSEVRAGEWYTYEVIERTFSGESLGIARVYVRSYPA